jgi:hypothetical protein
MTEHVLQSSGAAPHLRLSLNRPERRNAITVAMYAALATRSPRRRTIPSCGSSRWKAKASTSPAATTLPTS